MEWVIFAVLVAALFLIDLLSDKGVVIRSLVYIAVAIAFGGFIWFERSADDALKFYTGYALEMSLSLDNVFIISLIFTALAVPQELRKRVLLIGIVSALVLRGIFIGFGTVLADRFEWLLIICGIFLIYTGGKILLSSDDGEKKIDLEKNRTLGLLRRFVPISTQFDGNRFFSGGAATPLFVALVLVEIADLIFAADSVPATLAVTTDPFLVYTSNIFAILGLRALYGVLEMTVNTFQHVGKAVALVLVFIGVKVVGAHLHWFEIGNALSLGVVLSILAAGIVLSIGGKNAKAETNRSL